MYFFFLRNIIIIKNLDRNNIYIKKNKKNMPNKFSVKKTNMFSTPAKKNVTALCVLQLNHILSNSMLSALGAFEKYLVVKMTIRLGYLF